MQRAMGPAIAKPATACRRRLVWQGIVASRCLGQARSGATIPTGRRRQPVPEAGSKARDRAPAKRPAIRQIGRASSRERACKSVEISVVAVSLTKKRTKDENYKSNIRLYSDNVKKK